MFCILCGCDYLKNPYKVGIKKAYKIFNNNLRKPRFVFNYLKTSKVENFNKEYVETYERAYLTFKYQRVWCPNKKKMVSLNSVNEMDLFDEKNFAGIEISETTLQKDVNGFVERSLLIKHSRCPEGLSFLGPILPHDILQEIAECKRDPITKEVFKAPHTFENAITDVKFDQLRSMAFGMRKTESTNLPGVDQLSFMAKGKNQSIGQMKIGQPSLTSFFAKSQENSMNIFKQSKDLASMQSNRIDFQKTIEDDISEEEDNRPIFGQFNSAQQNRVISQKTQGASFSSTTAATRGQVTVSQMFKKFDVDENKTIVNETITNFRQSYINTIRNLK